MQVEPTTFAEAVVRDEWRAAQREYRAWRAARSLHAPPDHAVEALTADWHREVETAR